MSWIVLQGVGGSQGFKAARFFLFIRRGCTTRQALDQTRGNTAEKPPRAVPSWSQLVALCPPCDADSGEKESRGGGGGCWSVGGGYFIQVARKVGVSLVKCEGQGPRLRVLHVQRPWGAKDVRTCGHWARAVGSRVEMRGGAGGLALEHPSGCGAQVDSRRSGQQGHQGAGTAMAPGERQVAG